LIRLSLERYSKDYCHSDKCLRIATELNLMKVKLFVQIGFYQPVTKDGETTISLTDMQFERELEWEMPSLLVPSFTIATIEKVGNLEIDMIKNSGGLDNPSLTIDLKTLMFKTVETAQTACLELEKNGFMKLEGSAKKLERTLGFALTSVFRDFLGVHARQGQD